MRDTAYAGDYTLPQQWRESNVNLADAGVSMRGTVRDSAHAGWDVMVVIETHCLSSDIRLTLL